MSQANIVCIGGICHDSKTFPKGPLISGSSNPVTQSNSVGGVAHNIAVSLSRLGCPSTVVSPVGDDHIANMLLADCQQANVTTTHCFSVKDCNSASYHAVLDDKGELFIALANMEIFDCDTDTWLAHALPAIESASMVCLDTNPPAEVVAAIINHCHQKKIPLFVDPVSVSKAQKLPKTLYGVTYLFPDRLEAENLCHATGDKLSETVLCDRLIELGVENVVLTLGEQGCLLASRESKQHIAAISTEVVDVSGAGDALLSGFIAGLYHQQPVTIACQWGIKAASLTITSPETCHPELSLSAL